jgi:hypothetical protein
MMKDLLDIIDSKSTVSDTRATQYSKDMYEYGAIHCHSCGRDMPANGSSHEVIEVATGRSSGSTTYSGSVGMSIFNTSGKKRTYGRVGKTYNTGRTYYKNVSVDICAWCKEKENVGSEFWMLIGSLVFLLGSGWLWWDALQLAEFLMGPVAKKFFPWSPLIMISGIALMKFGDYADSLTIKGINEKWKNYYA